MRHFGRSLRSHSRPSGSGNPRAGQSIVEFAFAVPLMLLLLLGTLDLGQMFFEYIQLRGAVREGASYGARSPFDETEIRRLVKESAGLDSQGSEITTLTDANIPITRSAGCCVNGQAATITVAASLTFKPVTLGFFGQFGLDSVTLSASSKAKVLT